MLQGHLIQNYDNNIDDDIVDSSSMGHSQIEDQYQYY